MKILDKNIENELLFEMQNSFPMVQKPFKVIAKKLEVTQEEVINRVNKLKDEKIIRQTSAIFNTKRLGYKSSLVAFKIDPNRVDEVAKIINAHPGVSHNYLREDEYNIWFTIAVAPNSKLGLKKTIEILKEHTKAEDAIILPTLKMFKISVKMDTTGKQAKKEKIKKVANRNIKLTDEHIAIIKELQKDIEVIPEPFKNSIERLNMSSKRFFELAHELKDSGVMRRFATILNHRRAGFRANAMSVWSVPEERAEEIGRELAEFSAVSHCYLRPTYPNWAYNLFAMVHAKTQKECNTIIEDMAKQTGLKEYRKLYSTVEFKKQRLIYFDDAFREWEERVKLT